MTSDRKKRRAAKRTPEFPTLREFFSGYLDQDFRDEYGSAVGAAQRFEETPAIRKSRQFDESGTLGGRSWNKYRRRKSQKQCVNLGSAWRPESTADLDQLGGALGEGHSWVGRGRALK